MTIEDFPDSIPDKEDDDRGDDEDQQEDGDTQRLLLIGRLQLTLHSASDW